MQQQPDGSDGAILVSIDFGESDHSESLTELCLLAETAGVRVMAIVEARRQRPDAALFAGSGKVQQSPSWQNDWKPRSSSSITTFPPRRCAT